MTPSGVDLSLSPLHVDADTVQADIHMSVNWLPLPCDL